MCGLVMVLTKRTSGFTNEQKELFTSLLFVDTLRGKDSTGAFVVSNLGNVEMAKQASSAQAFIDAPEYKDLEKSAWEKGWAMVGHNRAATRGEVKDENAHPFIVDNKIVLVHNGTFSSDHKKLKDTAVDSEVIAHMLAENPTEEALRKVHAAYALIWYNVEEKKISFIRNNQRPLWFCETQDSYIVTSEESIMRFGMSRLNIKPMDDKRGPFLLKENYLVEIGLTADKKTTFEGRDVDIDFWKHDPYKPANDNVTDLYPTGRNGRYGRAFRDTVDGLYGMGEYDWDEDEYTVGRVVGAHTPSALKKESFGTKGFFQRQVVSDLLGDRAKSFTYDEWKKLESEYDGKKTVKAVVYDIIEADDEPKTNNFIMIGETLDNNKIPVVFPMTSQRFTDVMELTDGAIFEVDFNGMTWQSTKNTKEEIVVNDSVGLMLLHGLMPKPIAMASEPGHA